MLGGGQFQEPRVGVPKSHRNNHNGGHSAEAGGPWPKGIGAASLPADAEEAEVGVSIWIAGPSGWVQRSVKDLDEVQAAVQSIWGFGVADYWLVVEGRSWGGAGSLLEGGMHVQVRLRGVGGAGDGGVDQQNNGGGEMPTLERMMEMMRLQGEQMKLLAASTVGLREEVEELRRGAAVKNKGGGTQRGGDPSSHNLGREVPRAVPPSASVDGGAVQVAQGTPGVPGARCGRGGGGVWRGLKRVGRGGTAGWSLPIPRMGGPPGIGSPGGFGWGWSGTRGDMGPNGGIRSVRVRQGLVVRGGGELVGGGGFLLPPLRRYGARLVARIHKLAVRCLLSKVPRSSRCSL